MLAGAAARFFATASLGQDTRVMIDLLLALTTLGSLAICWMQANSLASAEQDRGTGLLIASKPLTAGQYAVGRWLGLVLSSGAIYVLSSLLALLIASWGQSLPISQIMLAWLVSGGELLVLAALANLFACWTTPTLASLLTLSVWFIGHSLDLLVTSTGWPWLGYILPNMSRFNLHETYVQATALPLSYYLLTAVYALAWSALLTALAALAVKRRAW
jgi:ABC-type transport system involved in multi-copper enzyme maturation permease subunit